jgi:hypothetical protein
MKSNERSGQLTVENFGGSIRFALDTGMNRINPGYGGAKMNVRNGKRKLSPEERAELHRMLMELVAGQRAKRPMLVCRNGVVVANVDVNVGPSDPNWKGREEIRVRR